MAISRVQKAILLDGIIQNTSIIAVLPIPSQLAGDLKLPFAILQLAKKSSMNMDCLTLKMILIAPVELMAAATSFLN
jgi:hypothetical protein